MTAHSKLVREKDDSRSSTAALFAALLCTQAGLIQAVVENLRRDQQEMKAREKNVIRQTKLENKLLMQKTFDQQSRHSDTHATHNQNISRASGMRRR
jgi:hypothetical protein